MVELDFASIEKKWQARWAKARAFEANVSKKPKCFTSIIIPYANSDLHIGHAFTYIRTDAWARFKRSQGANVLLAMGWHATGEPILGVVERLRQGDAVQIASLRAFGVTDHEMAAFIEHGPEYVARFWADRIARTAQAAGLSVDWRRSFITALDPCFNRFISWQYNRLREAGYVYQGSHPVIWCPHCASPTGDHDRLEGEGESPLEWSLLKFELIDELATEKAAPIYLVAGTLRPETIYGVTNLWVNPGVEYVLAMVGNELWICSQPCAEKLTDQLYDVREIGRIPGESLLGKRAREPVGNRLIPILPASWADPGSASGIVMSVPAHAPWDWAAILEFRTRPEQLEKYGVMATELEPISLIVSELGQQPGVDVCKQMGIADTSNRAKLESATSIVYKKEFHTGMLKAICGQYAGERVSAVKEKMITDFERAGIGSRMWEPTGCVVCRCATRCHVKILQDQWFLRYSDPDWKARARECLARMAIYPEDARVSFLQTIDWLKDKACSRRTGLGTPLPWDPGWIVETLSDSTIYMAYYTFNYLIFKHRLSEENLPDELFNFVFLGKGKIKDVARKSRLPARLIRQIAREFSYWYPLDLRNSGKDLLANHLTFSLFHHTALFSPKYWPAAFSVNGFVSVEGEKMSKSRGNFLPLADLIASYGADLVRLNIAAAAEGLDDADWRVENIAGYRNRLKFLAEMVQLVQNKGSKTRSNADAALLSALQAIIADTTAAYEQLRLRTAVYRALFDSTRELRWWIRRSAGKPNHTVLTAFLTDIIRLISPVAPHFAEEMWERLGRKKFIFESGWPKPKPALIKTEAEAGEELLRTLIRDVHEIKRIVKKPQLTKLTLFVAKTGKFKDVKQKKTQIKLLNEARSFLAAELGCMIEIVDSDLSDHKKADLASPEKPGILVE